MRLEPELPIYKVGKPRLWLRTRNSHAAAFTDVGMTAVAANGADVAGWRGERGLPSAIEASNKPVYAAAGGPGGRPSIDFTAGNNDRLIAGTAADFKYLHDGTGCTVYTVGKIVAGVNSPFWDTGALVAGGGGAICFVDDGANGGRLTYSVRNGSGGIFTLQTAAAYNVWPDAEWHIACVQYVEGASPNEARLFIDGSHVLGANSSGSPATGNSAGAFHIGYAATAGAIKLSGSVAEIIAFDKFHNEQQRRDVHTYLSQRYGLHSVRVDCLGHSIMESDGTNSGAQGLDHGVPITESIPDRLQLALGPRFRVRNLAWNGANIATGGPNVDVEEAWGLNNGPPAQGSKVCVFWMGINDVRADIAQATIEAAFDARVNAALASGTDRKVIVVNISPFGNDSGWSSGRQAIAVGVNAHMASFVAANPATTRLVDAYTLLGDPATPVNMLAAYDSGDGLHCGNAGLQAVAEAIVPEIYSLGV